MGTDAQKNPATPAEEIGGILREEAKANQALRRQMAETDKQIKALSAKTDRQIARN